MQEHILESDNFFLRFNLNVFVACNEYSAKAEMDINIKDFAEFSLKLMGI